MELLSRKEELILYSIWKLGDNAYGISVRDELERSFGIKWLFGSIYTPMSKLYDKGLIVKSESIPSEKGERAKVFFNLTPLGKKTLAQVKAFSAALWADIPPLNV